MEVTTGIRSILKFSFFYNSFVKIIAKSDLNSRLVNEHILAKPCSRILDCGCGTGLLINELPSQVSYTGVDISENYIKTIKENYGNRGVFYQKDVLKINSLDLGKFDCILLKGLIHHLNDEECIKLFRDLKQLLEPNGRIITFDGVYINKQNPIARWIISKDRGLHVRTEDAYIKLAKTSFSNVKMFVKSDYLKIPYNHAVMELTNDE